MDDWYHYDIDMHIHLLCSAILVELRFSEGLNERNPSKQNTQCLAGLYTFTTLIFRQIVFGEPDTFGEESLMV